MQRERESGDEQAKSRRRCDWKGREGKGREGQRKVQLAALRPSRVGQLSLCDYGRYTGIDSYLIRSYRKIEISLKHISSAADIDIQRDFKTR